MDNPNPEPNATEEVAETTAMEEEVDEKQEVDNEYPVCFHTLAQSHVRCEYVTSKTAHFHRNRIDLRETGRLQRRTCISRNH